MSFPRAVDFPNFLVTVLFWYYPRPDFSKKFSASCVLFVNYKELIIFLGVFLENRQFLYLYSSAINIVLLDREIDGLKTQLCKLICIYSFI